MTAGAETRRPAPGGQRPRSVLVVVVVVDRVQMLAVVEVQVSRMDHRGVTAVRAMDVHVAGMRDVHAHSLGHQIVHVVTIGVVQVSVVEEVEVVIVLDLRMSTPSVVEVRVGGLREVDLVGWSRGVRGHGADMVARRSRSRTDATGPSGVQAPATLRAGDGVRRDEPPHPGADDSCGMSRPAQEVSP
jgi:hypothetical protein